MTLSAPGTEAFKQDFARWHELKRQAAAALEQVESTLAKKLQEQDAKDRLASGADDRAPALYQEHVDSYFKALATKKKTGSLSEPFTCSHQAPPGTASVSNSFQSKRWPSTIE